MPPESSDEGALEATGGVCFPGEPGECFRVPKYDAPHDWVTSHCPQCGGVQLLSHAPSS